jgi:hypothetical protein
MTLISDMTIVNTHGAGDRPNGRAFDSYNMPLRQNLKYFLDAT